MSRTHDDHAISEYAKETDGAVEELQKYRCDMCKGHGQCTDCDGDDEDCPTCEGYGECTYCDGEGAV